MLASRLDVVNNKYLADQPEQTKLQSIEMKPLHAQMALLGPSEVSKLPTFGGAPLFALRRLKVRLWTSVIHLRSVKPAAYVGGQALAMAHVKTGDKEQKEGSRGGGVRYRGYSDRRLGRRWQRASHDICNPSGQP